MLLYYIRLYTLESLTKYSLTYALLDSLQRENFRKNRKLNEDIYQVNNH